MVASLLIAIADAVGAVVSCPGGCGVVVRWSPGPAFPGRDHPAPAPLPRRRAWEGFRATASGGAVPPPLLPSP